jgi:hypothetical protein
MKEILIKTTLELFTTINKASPKMHGNFKLLITLKVDRKALPVLIVGTAHSKQEDGYAIVVLNPHPDLFDQIKAGVAYHEDHLKDKVKHKCDFMIQLWFDLYKRNKYNITASYNPRNKNTNSIKIS